MNGCHLRSVHLCLVRIRYCFICRNADVAGRCEQRESLRASLPFLRQAEGIDGCLDNVLADDLADIANAWLDKLGSGDGPTCQ